MPKPSKTFAPGKSEIFWCEVCNLPLISQNCSTCNSPGRRIDLAPPGDIRLCSSGARDLLRRLFTESYGCADFLDDRIILLNKIAGLDRRDQVIIEGQHIATLWFDVSAGLHKLDLEPMGAALLSSRAARGLFVCSDSILHGHIKGKWLPENCIISRPSELKEGDNVVLKIGKFSGVGVARKRSEGPLSIRIKDVTKSVLDLSDIRPGLQEMLSANAASLRALEKEAISEIKGYLSKNRLPVNVSFSGGKDSLACLCLAQKALFRPEVLFINTGLEFPETVQYVRDLCRVHKLRLQEIESEGDFFDQVKRYGPPAKDFRWCCKTNKLGPMTTYLKEHYAQGCVTIEGRRIYESFNRSAIGAVERNPYVPKQTTLAPIRNWRAIEVMLYIHWNKMLPNPLYENDMERIGCWLCPSALQSEFAGLAVTHPQLYSKWNDFLEQWSRDNGLDERYIDWGFWRWKRHPPKIVQLANEHGIDLALNASKTEEVQLKAVRGRSPCGLNYSIEAALSAPQNRPFDLVAGALHILGEVKYASDLGAAVVKADQGRATVFANGNIMIIAGKEEAEELLAGVFETILRVQMCARCKICEKNCPQGAITVAETLIIDEKKCNHCMKCAQGCIVADEASKIYARLSRGAN
ncbi:MAG TPA: phosphoadenosine phosphosulfate reductase family protein [Methanothrix sp.]|nr:phosphoadenosine phosphosulfate reductase family protein [Methanothrix sp.]